MDQPVHKDRGHSPLGASGAERWMSCAGSVTLIARLRQLLDAMGVPEEDDPDYRREGTAMHEASEHCLREGCDTWEIVGQTFNDTVIDEPMADAIQVYLDDCRADMDGAALYYVEFPVSSPVHPDFYGTLDFSAIFGKSPGRGQFIVPTLVKVKDLKGGEGIIVEPDDNPQLKYYAYGLIDKNPHWADETPVELCIVQPRGFHVDGSIRSWRTTVGEIRSWVVNELVPAMHRTELDDTLDAGPWCRFCPAKLVCPLLTSLFRAACTANPKEVVNYGNDSLARSWGYSKAVKFYLTALEAETFRRLNAGDNEGFEGIAKLVPKKSNRVWNSDAKDEAQQRFGGEAFTKPEMKSPAELEKLSPAAKAFVKEHAYHPDTGLTVATWDDPKPAVKVLTTQQAFGDALKALGYGEDAA